MSGITSSILLGSSEIIGWGSGRIEVVVFSSAEENNIKNNKLPSWVRYPKDIYNILPVAVTGRLCDS